MIEIRDEVNNKTKKSEKKTLFFYFAYNILYS